MPGLHPQPGDLGRPSDACSGLHHVTGISAAATANHAFYTGDARDAAGQADGQPGRCLRLPPVLTRTRRAGPAPTSPSSTGRPGRKRHGSGSVVRTGLRVAGPVRAGLVGGPPGAGGHRRAAPTSGGRQATAWLFEDPEGQRLTAGRRRRLRRRAALVRQPRANRTPGARPRPRYPQRAGPGGDGHLPDRHTGHGTRPQLRRHRRLRHHRVRDGRGRPGCRAARPGRARAARRRARAPAASTTSPSASRTPSTTSGSTACAAWA